MKLNHRSAGVLLVLTLLLAGLPGMVLADTLSDLDSYYQELYPADEPGATILISRDGNAVYRKAFGMADIENGIANQTNMVFRLGSITKQFTAVAIMMLEQEGKLKVSDDMTKYLPSYTPPPSTITIEHLLTHTSGIPSYTGLEGWMSTSKIREKLSVEAMMDEWEGLELEFEPGSTWKYNNSGYYMLGTIIANVSGMGYDEFIEQRIFEPLGMNDSYYDHSELIIPNRARGYQRGEDGELQNADYLDMGQPYAAGSLASTVDDMAKWDVALYGDAILPQEVLQRMWTSYVLTDGSETGYGYGWSVSEHNDNDVISHGGGIFGFRTEGMRLPEQGLYVSVLSNGASASPDLAAIAAVKAMLEEPFRVVPVDVELSELEALTGVYRGSDDSLRNVTLEDGQLMIEVFPGFKLAGTPVGGNRFQMQDTAFEMVFGGEHGDIEHMEMQRVGWVSQRSMRTDDPLP